MAKSIIRVEEVWKTYQLGKVAVNALQGLNLDIKENEFVAIMGPSGSGKSTCINMVGALDIPTKGRILLEGKDISKLDESELAKIRGQKIGFIFQQFNLIHTLTAMENVMLPMIFQETTEEQREKRAKQLLSLVSLADRMNHKPTELSGGEQQRVAIARSLANDPDVIIADEPTGNLDSKTGEQIMGILCNLHEKEQKTIVMVTHDIRMAKCAHRIEHIFDGRIVKVTKNKR